MSTRYCIEPKQKSTSDRNHCAPRKIKPANTRQLHYSQKANKTVSTDQQGHFGWIKKDSTDMYKHWE